jgi:RNA recognition motif-containing protein
VVAADPVMGWRLFINEVHSEEIVVMEVKVSVRNLSRLTTHEELNTLFGQAGEVTSVSLSMNEKRNEARGFAFITMSTQSEADKAVSMFNAYSLDEHRLKVDLVRHRQQRGSTRTL